MSVRVPPGIAFLIHRIPQIFGPVIAVYVVLSALVTWDVHPFASTRLLSSTGAKLLLSLAVLPVITVARASYEDYSNRWRAYRLGARLPVRYEGKRWGGLDVLAMLMFRDAYIGEAVASMIEATGSYTVMFRTLLQDRIVTADPEHIKIMLSTQFENFIKDVQGNGTLGALLGNGIFSVDGEMWRFHRNTARPFFHRDRISDFDNFEKHVQVALDVAQARLDEGYAVDLQDLTSRFTMDSATTYLFDHDVQSLAADLPYPPTLGDTPARGTHASDAFCAAFANGQTRVLDRVNKGSAWPLFEFWTDSVRGQRDQLGSYIEPILRRAMERKQTRQGGVPGKTEGKEGEETWSSMLEYLASVTDDETLIMDTILNMLIAGRDTTACCLTFSLYMLSEHPSVLSRVREEILETVGTDRQPTLEDIRELKFLRAIINETLRLYPPVASNMKKSVNATVFPSKDPEKPDIFIPAGIDIAYSVLVLHRRKDLWGPDALEFDPDRWLDDRKKYYVSNPFIFMPFHAGPRICLGQQFAYHEVSYFLIRFLQRFTRLSHHPELQRTEDRPPALWMGKEGRQGKDTVRPAKHLTVYSKGGLWMKMHKELPSIM